MSIVTILFVVGLCCVVLRWLVWYLRAQRQTMNVPTMPGGLPVIGQMFNISGDSRRKCIYAVFTGEGRDSTKAEMCGDVEYLYLWRDGSGDVSCFHLAYKYSTSPLWWSPGLSAPWIQPIIMLPAFASRHYVGLYTFMEEVARATNEKGGILKFWFGPLLLISATDPEIAYKLYNSCVDRNYFYQFQSSWLGDGLITSKAATWKRHRTLLNPSFNQRVLDSFLEVFNSQSADLVEKLAGIAGKGEFDIHDMLLANSFGKLSQTALGIPPDRTVSLTSAYQHALEKILNIYITRIQNLWMGLDCLYYWTATKREEDRTVKILKDFSENVLKERKLHREASKTQEKVSCQPFLDSLLDLGDKGLLTDQEIREELDTILAAGTDTSTASILFIMILLGSYPEVQTRLYNEINETIGPSRDLMKDDIPKLVYLDAVVKETLRFYPIATGFIRSVTNDVVFENYTIPSGSTLVCVINGIHRHKCWGPDSDSFRPDRWLEPSSVPGESSAFAAFGVGRRSCIGKSFAMTSIKVTIAHLIRRYRVKADHKRLKLKAEIVLVAESGHEVALFDRNME